MRIIRELPTIKQRTFINTVDPSPCTLREANSLHRICQDRVATVYKGNIINLTRDWQSYTEIPPRRDYEQYFCIIGKKVWLERVIPLWIVRLMRLPQQATGRAHKSWAIGRDKTPPGRPLAEKWAPRRQFLVGCLLVTVRTPGEESVHSYPGVVRTATRGHPLYTLRIYGAQHLLEPGGWHRGTFIHNNWLGSLLCTERPTVRSYLDLARR